MNAEQFTAEFNSLMSRAFHDTPIPIHNIVLELTKAQHNALHLLALAEAQAATKSIIPANGKLPPFPNRG